jgi:hypothetical protein
MQLGTDSVTTASTPDELPTPDSAGLSGFHFHIDDKPMCGPEGPFLFQSLSNPYRISDHSMDIKSSVEIDLIFDDDGPDSATTPLYSSASKLGPDRRDTPVPRVVANPSTPLQSVPEEEHTSLRPDESRVASWTPQDVVAWLQKMSIDEGIIEKFFINDISGSVLLDLQPDDLKELDIQSFGKRHGLMSSIRQLRNSISGEPFEVSISAPSEPVSREPTPGSTIAEVGLRSCNATPVADEDCTQSPANDIEQYHNSRRRRRQRVVGPNDSISIVGIEQVFPKLHRCSKGEDCRKWQRQQARFAQYAQGLPVETLGSPVVVAGDPGNAATAPNLIKSPKSEAPPSIVASSDALGPAQVTELPISEKTLQDVRPRDAQENVRHFIKLQRLSQLQPVENPATPPKEHFPSPEADSPGKLAEKLQRLPTLRIPNDYSSSARSSKFSPSLSGQRTITPSVMRRRQGFQESVSEQMKTPSTSLLSPSDYYRQDPHYGFTSQTPLSEMDVPLTAIPIGPIERVFSQSVPPNMRFGYEGDDAPDPIPRPISTKVENHRRKLSVNTSQSALRRLDEGRVMSPIETPEDLDHTPRAAHCRANPFTPSGELSRDIIHSGWVKKRKTKNLVRHDWSPKYCALRNTQNGDERGTELAVYDHQMDAEGDSKALEYIDVDDYAVACSSVASSSKLTAAFKKTVLKRKDNTRGDTAFAFSLIPAPSGTSMSDRKSIFQTGKSHHFAVNTRDERIDWMRELMLARALRRGRDSGASLNVNGNIVL